MADSRKHPSSKPRYIHSIKKGVENKYKRMNDFTFVVMPSGEKFYRSLKNGLTLSEKEMEELLPIPYDYKAKENPDTTKDFLHK